MNTPEDQGCGGNGLAPAERVFLAENKDTGPDIDKGQKRKDGDGQGQKGDFQGKPCGNPDKTGGGRDQPRITSYNVCYTKLLRDMASIAPFGIAVQDRPDLRLFRRKIDDTVFIEQTDFLHAGLGPDLFHHLINPGAVVFEHLVVSRAQQRFAEMFHMLNGTVHAHPSQVLNVHKGEKNDGDEQNHTGDKSKLGDQFQSHGHNLPKGGLNLRSIISITEWAL